MKELRPTAVGPMVVESSEIIPGWVVLRVVNKDDGYEFDRNMGIMTVLSYSGSSITAAGPRVKSLRLSTDKGLLIKTDATDVTNEIYIEAMKADGIYEYASVALKEFSFVEGAPEKIQRQAVIGILDGKYYPAGPTVADKWGRRWTVTGFNEGFTTVILDGAQDDISDRKGVVAPTSAKLWGDSFTNWDKVFGPLTDRTGNQKDWTLKNFWWMLSSSSRPMCHINESKNLGGDPYVFWAPATVRKPTAQEVRVIMFKAGLMDMDCNWV